ncbi:UvrD-helicase domain-containing protein [Spongiimicrobium salis]|uniref:UvrD-helicase domain-containing protein n=1 Tax=Spongiimicrobium salis TaxID=1667022 RepID=UPI00374CF7AC
MQQAPYKIFNASAGSGKTYTLVAAYLKILLASNSRKNYRHILAITFTNKAVNEMKQRILETLFEFSQIVPSKSPSPMFAQLSETLGLPPQKLQEKSSVILKEILHNYAFFDISTIDKFTHRLIRTFAKDLKLPQNFEVVLDTELLLDEAVSKLIDNAGTDPKLTQVLIDFALEKIDEDKSWDLSIDLQKIGRLLFNENHAIHLKKLQHKSIDDFIALKKQLRSRSNALRVKTIEAAQAILQTLTDHGLETTDFTRQTLPNHFKKIIAKEYTRLYDNKLEENIREGKLHNKSLDPHKAATISQLQPQILSTYLELKQVLHHIFFLDNCYKNSVPFTVLNAIQKELKILEVERDQLPISSFNTIISNEIKDQPAPFIYERLGEKYHHYFIDEFQDTSEMQWQNLIPLIGNALEGEDEQGKKGSLLVVGDAKQAIYRWRGGKAEQFLHLIGQSTNPFVIPPQIESLPTNYRSHTEIINFNNRFFTTTSPFLNSEHYKDLFIEGNQQQSTDKAGGIVQLTFLEEGNDTDVQYQEQVLSTVKEIRSQGHPLNDICILTRKRKHGIVLADFLMRQGIPIISSETLLLNSSPQVQFLVCLLKYSTDPKNLEVAYEILYFLGQGQENIHFFIAQHLDQIPMLLWDNYGFDLEWLKKYSVFDGLERAIRQFDLAPNSNAYLTFFMDVILEVELKEGSNAQVFLHYWEKKKDSLSIAVPENMDAVQLMTVHKAKGLEFPFVLFPFANTYIYEEIDPKLWLPVDPTAFQGFESLLISKKKEVEAYSEMAEILYQEEQHKLELDAFNILYVALTRAVKGLYIITEKAIKSNGTVKTDRYSGLFIYYLQEIHQWDSQQNHYTFGTLPPFNDTSKSKTETQEIVPYAYTYKDRPSFTILTKSGSLWDTERESAITKGNLVHTAMGHITTEKDIPKALDLLQRNGDSSAKDIASLEQIIHQIIRHPKLAPYYKEGNIVYNERDIITENGLILRPDRVVLQDKEATIMDYKTGKKDPRYHQQLATYADAVEKMGFQIANRILIYINDTITTEFI